MTIADFLNRFNPEPDSADDEAFDLAVDQAEGALRAGVRLETAEYYAMTAELRAAWIMAGNRILRDGSRTLPNAPRIAIRDEVEDWVDQLAEAAFGRVS